MSHLLVFHIGPVQEFITTARRTQDLWIGSWLLSYLSKTAIMYVQDQHASSPSVLVLPAQINEAAGDALADTPNYFTARITVDKPRQLAEDTDEAVRNIWSGISGGVRDKFLEPSLHGVWDEQAKRFLEIYWAIVPDDGTADARQNAQCALDARKRLRDFEQPEEPGQKCTLCGVRQGLLHKNNARKGLSLLLRQGERLCAVCAIKRGALRAKSLPLNKLDGSFPSTSSIAAASWKRQMLQMDKTDLVGEALRLYLDALDRTGAAKDVQVDSLPALTDIDSSLPQSLKTGLLSYDGDVLYPETLTAKRFCEEFPEAEHRLVVRLAQDLGSTQEEIRESGLAEEELQTGLQRCVKSLKQLYKAAGRPPVKYYATLMMDGDHMGAFFGKATEVQAKELSRALSRLVPELQRIVQHQYAGRLIYAGGDDVLAFLPLEDALPCAVQLQAAFKDCVSAVIAQVGLPDGVSQPPTPSAGIALAHHTAPLETVLLAMRQAEKSAKRRYGRDAICVYVLKRSGEEIRAGTHWTAEGLSLVGLVQESVGHLQEERISTKFFYSFAGEARFLAALPVEARRSELRRLLKQRHYGTLYQEEKHGPTFDRFAQDLAQWADVLHVGEMETKPLGLEAVADWMLLARFIARGGTDEE